MKVGERLSVWDTLGEGELIDEAWKYRLARIAFDGLAGEVPADARRAQGMFTVRWKSEQVQFRFPMRKDPVQGWEPVDGRKAVHDAAMRNLALQLDAKLHKGRTERGRAISAKASGLRDRLRRSFVKSLRDPKIRNGPNPHGTAAQATADKFNVSRRTVYRATVIERKQITREVLP